MLIFGDPANITASMSHFEARLQVWSVGKNIAGNLLNVRVTRWLPNGTILPITTQQFEIPRVRDTISLIIPNDLPINGISTFLFTLDFGNEIAEMCETNNSASRATNMVVYNSINPILSETLYRASAEGESACCTPKQEAKEEACCVPTVPSASGCC